MFQSGKMELNITNLSKTYKQFSEGVQVLKNINFTLYSGEVTFLCGLNGSGKSTLLKILYGLEDADENGDVVFNNGKNRLNWAKHGRNFSTLLPQKLFDANAQDILISEYMSLFDKKKIEDFLELLDAPWLKNILDSKVDKLIKEMSIGQQQILISTVLLANHKKILFFDEVFSAMDEKKRAEYMKVIQKLVRNKDLCSIIVSHDYGFSYSNADRLLVLSRGELILDATKESINEDEFFQKILGS